VAREFRLRDERAYAAGGGSMLDRLRNLHQAVIPVWKSSGLTSDLNEPLNHLDLSLDRKVLHFQLQIGFGSLAFFYAMSR